MKAPSVLGDFVRGLRDINTGAASVDGDDAYRNRIKKATSSVYDMAAMGAPGGALWNWGMHDPELAAEIERRMPAFDRFDTDGFSEQLYFLALRDVPIDLDDYGDRAVLEVGCGMGEGLNFLSRLVGARRMVGLDLSPLAVKRANARLARGDRLRYVQGDAEALPFEDGELDVVINIESSHSYPDLGAFFAEVSRVLRPGGYFSHIDLFTRPRYDRMKQLKAESPGLVWVHERDVSEQVRAAVSRRSSPGSRFRKVFDERRMPYLQRRLAVRGHLIHHGAQFAGYRDDLLLRTLKRLGMVPGGPGLPVDGYRHHIARKG